ncbi:MAG TPA: hypothetical protein VG621_02105 [Candidatus Paceibacterota bacterium]|nr:hypothetical protein [Candidatus Paceibacterota bacterium]
MENIKGKEYFKGLPEEEQDEHNRSLETTKASQKKDAFYEEQQEHLYSIEKIKQEATKNEDGASELKDEIKKTLTFTPHGDTVATREVMKNAQTIWQKPEHKKESPWKKFKGLFKKSAPVVVGGILAAGSVKADAAKNPEDSTLAKAGKEKVASRENSAELRQRLPQDWNDYLDWLDTLNLRGNEALDHNDLGGAMIDRYVREHPGTSLSRESVKDIQKFFVDYKNWVLDQIKNREGMFKSKEDEEHFLEGLSKVDNWAGSQTTRYKFPRSYLVTLTKTADYGKAAQEYLKKGAGHIDDKMNNVPTKDTVHPTLEDEGLVQMN